MSKLKVVKDWSDLEWFEEKIPLVIRDEFVESSRDIIRIQRALDCGLLKCGSVIPCICKECSNVEVI